MAAPQTSVRFPVCLKVLATRCSPAQVYLETISCNVTLARIDGVA